MPKIGFVGLGIMGMPMCKNLLKGGAELTVTDLDETRVAALTALGAKSGTYAEIAESCEFILMILPEAGISYGVIEQMAPHLRAGSIVCDMSSVTPEDSEACRDLLAPLGVEFVDAPVSGGEPGAVNGTLAVMCGGTESAFERLRPVFAMLGKSAECIGPCGAGSVCKLVNQAIVNINICAAAEAMTFAQKAGADPMKVYRAIRGGLAGSRVLDDKVPMMCRRDFRPGGTLKVNRKDIKNVLATAHKLECPMPFTAQVYELMQALAVSGGLMDDQAGYVRYFERLAGIEVHSDENA
ncbi:MAG: NAD-binding protein [Oscillibacter sp.]|nr:NAD-binding protein [Oscillibacter sp.]